VAFSGRAIILATMSSRSAAAAARTPRAIRAEEEEELELPPLDGTLDEREESDDEGDDVEIDGELSVDGDDGVAAELDPGVTLDVEDEPGADGDEAARDAVDVGAMTDAIALLDEEERTTDEEGLLRYDEDESPFDAHGDDEAGAGTGEDPSGFVDERALPPLDADERDEAAGALRQAAFGEQAVPWSRARWRVASGMGAQVPCSLVAVSSAHVVAAGPTVLVARGGARVTSGVGPDVDAVAVAATDEAIFVAPRRGPLFVSTDGGATWATGSVPWPSATGPLEVAATPGRLWICEGGALWSVRWDKGSRPEPPLLVRASGVRAMAAADTTLVILAERDADLVMERLRGDDEAPPAEAVPRALRAAIGDAGPGLAAAAGGRAIAVIAGRSVYVSRDGGRSYGEHEAGSALAVAFAGDGEDAQALVLATAAERGRDAPLYLMETGDDGGLVRVAEVASGAGASACGAALAWDAAREVVWVACSAGLLAFERAPRH